MATFVRASLDRPAYTLPGFYFTSAEVFAREQERIFARQWICAGRSADVPAAGDYRLIEVAGENLILLRDQNGQLRAYYNVCRHRGRDSVPRRMASSARVLSARTTLGRTGSMVRWQRPVICKMHPIFGVKTGL